MGPAASPLPTPVPTVSAKGDPHLVNLQGEHFDINHEGEFVLLRIPQDTNESSEMALRVTIRPEHGKPCTTYITEVELSGAWFGGKYVQVRSDLKSHLRNTTDKFLGIRVLEHNERPEPPWQSIMSWTEDDTLFEQDDPFGFQVTLSKTQWFSKKSTKTGEPTVAGQFTAQMMQKQNDVSATIVIRQDMGQEHLNVAVRRLNALGRMDIGGLLGFDAHPESLEDITPECRRHRDRSAGKNGPVSRPSWKTRWAKIREQRDRSFDPDESASDADASANLIGKMCVCPSQVSMEPGADEGFVADFQTGKLAEAVWD